jgi:hypothetical protein
MGVHTPLAQHPLGHDVASQTHSPSEHRSPSPHALLIPQRQTPIDEQLSASWVPHCTHVDPAEPQLESERAMHVVPLQHPLGHDVASHTHRPPAHRCPDVQAAAPPHVHVPCVHPSVVFESHVPHEHAPLTHAWPVAHAGPPPQVQAPAVQPSPLTPQDWQVPPAAPHAVAERALHVVPEQQPSGQVQPVQAPPTQLWPSGHAAQAWPALPQAVSTRPVSHVVPLQQPLHVVGSHTHLPPTQCWFEAHAGPVPQAHVPSDPQPSLAVAEHPRQTQTPVEHTSCPVA